MSVFAILPHHRSKTSPSMLVMDRHTRKQVRFAWLPVPMYANVPTRSPHFTVTRRVGWVWWRNAFMTCSGYHPWVAFLEEQTEENLSRCRCCGLPEEGA